jgi:hypothetical protein
MKLFSVMIELLFIHSFLIPPAFADWQYTRWGMSSDEIVLASNGAACKIEGKEQEQKSGARFTTLAIGKFSTGPFEFEVSFRTAKGGAALKTVRLNLRNPDQYQELWNAISAKYGKGEVLPKESDGAIERVRWYTQTDIIILQRVKVPENLGVHVALEYEKKLANINL